MTNDEISAVLRSISGLMQIKGEDTFRARIYERAADAIEALAVEARQLADENRLRSIPGVGRSIEQMLIELLAAGRCSLYEELTRELGEGVLDLLAVRGVGVKTAARLYQELGVKNLRDLREAINAGRLTEMKRMGAKTVALIDEGLRFLESQRKMRSIGRILPIADEIFNGLRRAPGVNRLDFTGEFRRREEMLQSLEFVAESPDPVEIHRALSQIDGVTGVAIDNQTEIIAQIENEFPLRVYCVGAETYEATLFATTCAEAHLNRMNQAAAVQKVEAIGSPPPDWTKNKTESELYGKLGLPFIVPELRGEADSIEAALADKLPTLITLGDLRGDLHMHTTWSDGRNSIREMAEAAKAIGHEYIAITDHSQASQVANGLTPQRLLEQIQQIREINAEIDGVEILVGGEVDIHKDGSLDFDDEVLAQLDIIVASIHQAFSLSEAEMTARVISAIENPFVTIIGHPTGRLLGRRPGYAVNLDEIISAAAEHRVALEINASPSRLDLGPIAVRKAREKGVLLSINTDAHAIVQLEQGIFGVNVARRGWLEKADVLNTYPLAKVLQIADCRL